MRIFNYIILLFLILLGITFAVLNAESVAIHYYFNTSKLPLSLLLVLVLTIGIILGFLAGFIRWLALKKENFRLHQRLKLAEKEIENLRAIPLKDNR